MRHRSFRAKPGEEEVKRVSDGIEEEIKGKYCENECSNYGNERGCEYYLICSGIPSGNYMENVLKTKEVREWIIIKVNDSGKIRICGVTVRGRFVMLKL
jgi:hypothetical protein